jgi:lysophospholipase L1-like esterase
MCFVGDSFVQGTCDPLCLGWVGRVAAHARLTGVNLTSYNLGIRRNTSRDIALRWQQECAARFPADCQRYIVFSFGVNDTTIEDGALRVPEAESIEHFRTIVSQASAQYATAVVGPPPIADASQNARIRHLSDRFAEVAQALNVPYLPVYETLQADPVWMAEVAAEDGAHPGSQGYTRLAELVLAWPQWWFQSSVRFHWEVPHVRHR